MAKKKYSEDVQNAYGAYASEVQSAGQDLASGMAVAGQQQMAEMEAANKAYNDANNAAIETNRQRSDAAIGSFADMVEGYAQNIRNAEAESAAQVAADQRAARWTGATELASSIANLIAVGGHNAVSQQYKPYSQDWMRKADQDARLNRARIDNLRERQRAMQGQLANMRMNDAARALELARADAKARYDQGLALSQARYNTTVNPLVQAGKTAEEVGKINAQGVSEAAGVAQRERQLDLSAAQLQQRKDEHAAAMLAKGYNPDGSVNEEAMSKLTAATRNSGKNGGSEFPYDITIDGKRFTIDMQNKDTFESALEFGGADLKRDIARMAGVGSWKDLKKRIEKKGDLQTEYSDIVRAIEKGGEDSMEVIRKFIGNNRDDLNEFNGHLARVAKSGRFTGLIDPLSGQKEEKTPPAPGDIKAPADSTKPPVDSKGNVIDLDSEFENLWN